ncbi:MAG TPA: nuclear transport factor 2 family protein [Longimicrobiales bacterium]|nr:nuclear transport factor 2 family protein [Longimicrobiales bacterium]
MIAMRSRSLVIAGCLLLPLAACAPDTETEEMPPPTEELAAPTDQLPADVMSVSDQYIAAWNGNDPQAVSTFFLEDATVTVGDSTWTGRAQIMTGWLQPNVAAINELEITETRAEQHGADWHSEGTYRHRAMEGDTTGSTSGRYEVMWTRAPDGQWRIRSSEVMPDAPATAPRN